MENVFYEDHKLNDFEQSLHLTQRFHSALDQKHNRSPRVQQKQVKISFTKRKANPPGYFHTNAMSSEKNNLQPKSIWHLFAYQHGLPNATMYNKALSKNTQKVKKRKQMSTIYQEHKFYPFINRHCLLPHLPRDQYVNTMRHPFQTGLQLKSNFCF